VRPLVDRVNSPFTQTCAGSRYFRQLQEISDSVGEARWDDVDVGLALQRNRVVQTQLERRIVTGRARQRFVRPFVPWPVALTYESSSPIYLKSKTLVEVKRTSIAYYVKASCYVDTSLNGRVRSLRSTLVYRC
jgi:hypothetical protein